MSLKFTVPITAALLLVTVSQAQASPLESQLSKTTIGGMNAFKKGMSAKIPAQASSVLGGLTSINCPKGATPASCIPMAVWNTTFRTGDLTPADIAAKTGKSLLGANQTLTQATPWLSRLKVSEVLAADPSMATMPVTTADGRRTTLGALGRTFVGGRTGGVKQAPEYNRILGEVVDLRQTKISQFPQIQNIQLKRFPSLAKLPATAIPGLPQIKIPDLPGFAVPGGIALMKLDVIRTKEKNIHHMVMSGSNRQPNAKCEKNCDYGEFHPWVGMPYLRGAKIISGDSQSVRGGEGLLSWVNGGMEPTGVEANIGTGGIKFVLRNLNAKQGTATVAINFRACGWLVGCTPYFLGIPLFTISETNNWFPIMNTNASVYRRVIK